MSLLQSEEFTIYRLRTSYLHNIHDGVGERLINLDTAFLNDPAYKAAGWSANPPELKRCYSPPIPSGRVGDYFKAPNRDAPLGNRGPQGAYGGRNAEQSEVDEIVPEDEDDLGGMVTGVGSNDGVGPTARRRRRREQMDEDDSSDLSDESEEISDAEVSAEGRPANHIKFAKMPDRGRAGSSPNISPVRKVKSKSSDGDESIAGPDMIVTSPSRPPDYPNQRRGSLGAVEALKQRERRDTTTSSEVSSENELDPSLFQRRQIQSGRGGKTLAERIEEDEEEPDTRRPDPETERHELEEVASVSDDSSLASGFDSDTEDPQSILHGSPDLDSPEFRRRSPRRPSVAMAQSPEKEQQLPETLPELPPPRPISTVLPKSALAAALKASNAKPVSPFERFATLSGQGEPNPLYIKIYLPPECEAERPLEIVIRRNTSTGGQTTVAELIGYSLWRYEEEGMDPSIPKHRMNVNWWTLRIVEDEEVDFDFPPLSRQRPLSDFTSTNNRPPRARARDKPWDDFALVEATDQQFAENDKTTPMYSQDAVEAVDEQKQAAPEPPRPQPMRQQSASDPTASRTAQMRRNPVTDPMFVSTALRKDSALPAADAPPSTTATAAPRAGAQKTLNIHFTDNNLTPHIIPIPVTTDTYIAEVQTAVCQRLNIDKALYVLKVSNTPTVAPSDRTVEALGPARQSLDLVRRRFIGDGTFGLSGSPGSTSPNAPLLIPSTSTPTRRRLRGGATNALTGLTGAPAAIDLTLADPSATVLPLGGTLGVLNPTYKRYNVLRKQPMSFAPSHPRVLALDAEYMHVMPADNVTGRERLLWDHHGQGSGKTSSVHFSGIVGTKINRKHPKTFRVIVFREVGSGAAAGGVAGSTAAGGGAGAGGGGGGFGGGAGAGVAAAAAGLNPGGGGGGGGLVGGGGSARVENKRYDFEAQTAEEAREIVEEIRRGVGPYRDAVAL